MKGTANTRVTILRGTETDEFGDTVDSAIAVHTDVLASIIESSRRVYLPAEKAYRVVQSLTCRIGAEADIRKDDRIRDQRNGTIYQVTELTNPQEFGGTLPDRILTLSRTI